jgi:hypothetical protein
MNALILHPTATAQWQALVHEAEHSCAVHLADELESYLVFLLMRFCDQPRLAASVLALEFLRSLEIKGLQSQTLLRDVGDKCLLFSGLFPGIAERRRVRISYFVHLGQSAYGTLADTSATPVFTALCERFVALMDILHAMRELAGTASLLPLQAQELWNDTGSPHALSVLRRHTSAVPLRENTIEKPRH